MTSNKPVDFYWTFEPTNYVRSLKEGMDTSAVCQNQELQLLHMKLTSEVNRVVWVRIVNPMIINLDYFMRGVVVDVL